MFKQNPHYIFQKNYKKLIICRKEYYSTAMQTFLQNPDLVLESPNVRYFKNTPGESSTVGLLTIDNIAMVVKRYNIKSFWHGIKIWFRKSRAMTSWLNAHRLSAIDVPTVEPIAVVENRHGPLRNKAYFIYRYVAGNPVCNYFEQHQTLTPFYAHALKKIAESMNKLKDKKIRHRDCHHNNMVMLDDNVLLLDLDHMKQYHFMQWRFRRAHQKDIQQFIQYLGENQEAKEFFIKALQEKK